MPSKVWSILGQIWVICLLHNKIHIWACKSCLLNFARTSCRLVVKRSNEHWITALLSTMEFYPWPWSGKCVLPINFQASHAIPKFLIWADNIDKNKPESTVQSFCMKNIYFHCICTGSCNKLSLRKTTMAVHTNVLFQSDPQKTFSPSVAENCNN